MFANAIKISLRDERFGHLVVEVADPAATIAIINAGVTAVGGGNQA